MIEGFFRMTSALKTIVSKNKRRYQENGYNLDLAYINPRLIAMGYPSENVEAWYRNSLEEVKRFLDDKHKDHYRIYNLCSEKEYDAKKFHGRVVNFPFDDHNPPNFNSIRLFCEDAEKWLKAHKDNVCVVHCKAGKGRTGVMICCFLLRSNREWSAGEALSYYGKARTLDSKGVTIPSQKRYISYYYHYLRHKMDYLPTTLHLASVSIPSYFPGSTIYVEVHQMNYKSPEPSTQKIFESKGIKRSEHAGRLEIPINAFVAGDVKVEFHFKGGGGLPSAKRELFHLWFNTAFVEVESELCHTSSSNGSHLVHLLKDASISSEEHLLSERLSSDSSHSSSSNPESAPLSGPPSSFRDKRVRHSSLPQTGGVPRRSTLVCPSQVGGKHIELSLSRGQLDKFPKDKSLSRRPLGSGEEAPVFIRLIKPEKQSSWTPPPGLHGGSSQHAYSSSPEESSTEEEEEEDTPSDVFQQETRRHRRNHEDDAPRQTWI